MSEELTVLVNSTDSFEDCWAPFFTLFDIYWPDCPYSVVLNTETKDYQHDRVKVHSSKTALHEHTPRRIPWGECLFRCLSDIRSDYVLYLQEDFFLNGRVDMDLIKEFIDIMSTSGIPHIHLMYLDRRGVYSRSRYHPLLWEIKENANYRISLQAGLWRRDTLLSYIKSNETPWEFERWGTKRSYERNEIFLCQNMDEFNAKGRYVFPYRPTGIVRGKWVREIVEDLFSEHEIKVDFSRRGFYEIGPIRRIMIPVRRYIRVGAMAVLAGLHKR